MKKKSFKLGIILLLALSSYTPSTFSYDIDYFNTVIGEKAVKFADGLETIATLLQIEQQYPDFIAQRKFLEKTGILSPKWKSRSPDDILRRGELAYMLVKMLRLKGGLKARILGMNQRFAMEELIYEGIMREGHQRDLITGQELVYVATSVAEFMAARHESTSHES